MAALVSSSFGSLVARSLSSLRFAGGGGGHARLLHHVVLPHLQLNSGNEKRREEKRRKEKKRPFPPSFDALSTTTKTTTTTARVLKRLSFFLSPFPFLPFFSDKQGSWSQLLVLFFFGCFEWIIASRRLRAEIDHGTGPQAACPLRERRR